MTGRPTVFTPEIEQELCERIANDESLVSICASEHMPAKTTVYRWLHEMPPFRDNYTRARGDQAHTVADEVKKVREDLRAGLIDPNTANAMLNLIKWETGKRNPKAYGDKLTTELTGADGGPIQSAVSFDPSKMSTGALQELLEATNGGKEK